jgi:lactoylglutathione lyase
MRLTHTRLLVANFDACFRFYRDVIGLEVKWGAEGAGYADLQAKDGASLSLFQREAMSEALGTLSLPYEVSSQDRFALIIETDDLEAAITQLRQRGANFTLEAREHPDWGIRTSYLRDPDGNLIELNSPMPHSEWSEELQEEAGKYGANEGKSWEAGFLMEGGKAEDEK